MFVQEMGLPARLALYVLASLLLMVADARYDALVFLRTGLATVMHPLQAGLARPFLYLQDALGFFVVHGELLRDNHQLLAERRQLLADLRDKAGLIAENTRLRGLLDLDIPAGFVPHAAQIVQAQVSPFARQVVIDRGSVHGIAPGWPVVDSRGLVGQVTRVYPGSSEVTLIISREQAVPVQSLRSGARLILSGVGTDRLLEVRYLDMHADLQADDLLLTSGLDGVYPPGIPVARVLHITPPRHTPFAQAMCAPIADVGEHRHLLVLQRSGGRAEPGDKQPIKAEREARP